MAGRPTKKRKAATKRPATKKPVPKKPTPKKTAPGKTKTASKKVPPKKTAPKKTPPKKTTPRKRAAAGRTPAERRPSRSARRVPSGRSFVDDEAPTVEIPAPSTERSPRSTRPSAAPRVNRTPPARPSERVLASVSDVPVERPLTDEEREAMAKVAEKARVVLDGEGEPTVIVAAIASFLDDVRLGCREEPDSQDVRLGLGVLWGEQLRVQVGWRWVHLTYPDGFASYALVPDDRAFACFPLNRVPEALKQGDTSTSAQVFESIREGALPARKPGAYLVVG